MVSVVCTITIKTLFYTSKNSIFKEFHRKLNLVGWGMTSTWKEDNKNLNRIKTVKQTKSNQNLLERGTKHYHITDGHCITCFH